MYRFATLKDEELNIAKIVYGRCNTFHEEQPEEILEEMKAGSVMKWQELNESVSYTKEWTPCKANSKDVAFIATAEWALSYSTQKTNGLKESDPKMHAVLRLVQIPLNKYINANKQALVKKVEEYHNKLNNIQRVRAVTADFTKTVKETLEALKTRCKNAKNRGDTSADDKRLHEAVSAFNKVWLK
jgi:hypothetical protein